ncbi:MAG: M3 family oligoendopeptidase [Ardenticatenales bacterium]|nr:M3 family oligoendopeptidase [Ardenticatenales bacterium]
MSLDAVDTRSWDAINEHYKALEEETLTPPTVQNWLQRWSDLEAQIMEAVGQAASRTHENTADKDAEALHLHYLRNILPKLSIVNERLKVKLLDLEGYEPPADQQMMMRDFRTERALFREENVPLETELSVLATEHRKITGQMTIEWEGETLTLDQAELLLSDPERETRERAWRKVHETWEAVRPTLDEQYLKMLSLRRQIAKNAGFENYRAFAWLERGRYEYTPSDAFTFHDAIEHQVVLLARKIFETQRQTLGVAALRPWDLMAEQPGMAPLAPFQTGAELEEGCTRIFQAIDAELGAQFEQLRGNGCLELESRANKAPGGYCRALPVSKRSYIFMNAVGKQENVRTLLHEGGHAFHNQHACDLPLVWMRHAPMEMAEVASMAMELLAYPFMEKEKGGFYSPEEADRARVEHLEKIVLFLPYMAVVDAFQHWVYAEAPANVTADDMDATWSSLWERFMGGVDWQGLQEEKESGWHRKRHIFVYPFYYIEYGLAQLGALQVWRNAQTDPAAALSAYRRTLALGGTRSLPELYESAGIRFAFDRATVRDTMQLVETHLDALTAKT